MSIPVSSPINATAVQGLVLAAGAKNVHDWYGYVPNSGACIAFISVFSFLAMAHLLQAWKTDNNRLSLVQCCIVEVAKWTCRFWSHENPEAYNPYFVQSVIGFVSSLFVTQSLWPMLARKVGQHPHYSWATPDFIRILGNADSVSILAICFGMGAGGGDEASEALARKFKLAYSVIYTGSMVTYLLTICDFCRRIRLDKPYNPQADHAQVDQRWWYQMLAIAISSCAMLVRGGYHIAAYSEGGHHIHHTESLEFALDGVPMIIAVGIFTVLYVGEEPAEAARPHAD